MATAIHTEKASVWVGPQTALGTGAFGPMIKSAFDGDRALGLGRENKTKNYADGATIGASVRYTDRVGGDVGGYDTKGTLPDLLFALWFALGGTITKTAEGEMFRYDLVYTPTPKPHTIWQSRGLSPNTLIEKYMDCVINKLTVSTSAGDKPLVIGRDILSLQPAQFQDAEPTLPVISIENDGEPLYHYDTDGTEFLLTDELGGTIAVATHAESVGFEFSRNYEAVQTGRLNPSFLAPARAGAVTNLSTYWSDDVLGLLKRYAWGAATPADGASPVSSTLYGSLVIPFRQGDEELTITMDKGVVALGDIPGPKPEGGSTFVPVTFEAQVPDTGEADTIKVSALLEQDWFPPPPGG